MFVIVVYDVNQKRVNKVLKICRKYLYWVQNSVLEGEITPANYKKMQMEIKKVIDEEEDSVIYYQFRTMQYSKRETMGVKKGGEEMFV